jgi:hypothetical protein
MKPTKPLPPVCNLKAKTHCTDKDTYAFQDADAKEWVRVLLEGFEANKALIRSPAAKRYPLACEPFKHVTSYEWVMHVVPYKNCKKCLSSMAMHVNLCVADGFIQNPAQSELTLGQGDCQLKVELSHEQKTPDASLTPEALFFDKKIDMCNSVACKYCDASSLQPVDVPENNVMWIFGMQGIVDNVAHTSSALCKEPLFVYEGLPESPFTSAFCNVDTGVVEKKMIPDPRDKSKKKAVKQSVEAAYKALFFFAGDQKSKDDTNKLIKIDSPDRLLNELSLWVERKPQPEEGKVSAQLQLVSLAVDGFAIGLYHKKIMKPQVPLASLPRTGVAAFFERILSGKSGSTALVFSTLFQDKTVMFQGKKVGMNETLVARINRHLKKIAAHGKTQLELFEAEPEQEKNMVSFVFPGFVAGASSASASASSSSSFASASSSSSFASASSSSSSDKAEQEHEPSLLLPLAQPSPQAPPTTEVVATQADDENNEQELETSFLEEMINEASAPLSTENMAAESEFLVGFFLCCLFFSFVAHSVFFSRKP